MPILNINTCDTEMAAHQGNVLVHSDLAQTHLGDVLAHVNLAQISVTHVFM